MITENQLILKIAYYERFLENAIMTESAQKMKFELDILKGLLNYNNEKEGNENE